MKTIEFVIDPTESFLHIAPQGILESCGLIPMWVFLDMDNNLKDSMEAQYGFGPLHEMTGGEVQDDGTYVYPNDPELKPLIKITRGDDTMYQYQYGVVAFKQDLSWFVTRMD